MLDTQQVVVGHKTVYLKTDTLRLARKGAELVLLRAKIKLAKAETKLAEALLAENVARAANRGKK